MKILFCGGRDFKELDEVYNLMFYLYKAFGEFTVIEGGALGADELAKKSAIMIGLPVETYPANWELHGKSAGHIRNQQMLDEGKPD